MQNFPIGEVMVEYLIALFGGFKGGVAYALSKGATVREIIRAAFIGAIMGSAIAIIGYPWVQENLAPEQDKYLVILVTGVIAGVPNAMLVHLVIKVFEIFSEPGSWSVFRKYLANPQAHRPGPAETKGENGGAGDAN